MKLNETKPFLETSGGFDEQFFSIEDQGMIFDILRNKMYSNPILAIAREITCNARDAHREVGTPEKPIEITVPTWMQPEYRVKDYGPGISPDRMTNIFIKYTASTKRADNLQTGGFGLGAKTPFSYSDSFSIITVHNGIRYLYNCLIDETKVGKLMLASSEPSDEPNGTEIIIPIKDKNFQEFATWTEQACRHWDVKPIIKGGTIQWKQAKRILEGTGWAITENNDWRRQAHMVIDGIEYPLDIDTLRKYASSRLFDSIRGNFIMYFGVGELSLSASREQIYLDEATQKAIRERLAVIQAELTKLVESKIAAFPNLWDANVFYRKDLQTIFSDLTMFGTLTWNNVKLLRDYMYTGGSVFIFRKGKTTRYKTDPNKISRTRSDSVTFSENALLYLNDLTIKEPTPKHLKKAFDDNPGITTVYVICPTDKLSLDDMTTSHRLDLMEAKNLSSITTAKTRASTAASQRLLIFKFDPDAHAFRQVTHESFYEDTSTKVFCYLQKDEYHTNVKIPVFPNKKTVPLPSMHSISQFFKDVSFYGVDVDAPADRVEEEFSELQTLEEFIDEKIIKNKSINYLQLKYASKHTYDVDDRMLRTYDKIYKMIDEPASLFLNRLTMHKKIKEIGTTDSKEIGLLRIYESVSGDLSDKAVNAWIAKNPDFDIEKINKEYELSYALLNHIHSYNYSDLIPHIAKYVNLIDSERKNKENK